MLNDNTNASDMRGLMNRKMDIESQMNDLQSDINKIKRQKDEAELEIRVKKKEMERMRVELFDIEAKEKKRSQDQFELEAQYMALKKQLDRVMVEIKNARQK